ncbi:MAG: VOC family protein [Candidatus Dormibacteraeota bacterium]|nr:VOC family protein [Candidatus Dormibacteraeota bacterium]
MTTTATKISAIANVTVQVPDHEKAIAFYTDTLGFETRRDAQYGPGLRWVEVAPAGSSTVIALASPRQDFHPADTGIRLTTPDAEAAHAALREQGVDVDEDLLRIPNVPPMFSFRDPHGNTLYIVEGA